MQLHKFVMWMQHWILFDKFKLMWYSSTQFSLIVFFWLQIIFLALQQGYGGICTSNSQCQTNYTCKISGGNSGTCSCTSLYYYSIASAKCLPKLSLNAPCTFNDICIDYASCALAYGAASYSCICQSGYYALNGACGKTYRTETIFLIFFNFFFLLLKYQV